MSALASGAKSNSQSGSPSFQESKPRKENKLRRCTAIVAATADKMGIGMNGSLPWKLPGDMNFFSKNYKHSAKRESLQRGGHGTEDLGVDPQKVSTTEWPC